VCRVGDSISCGDTMATGSENVFVNNRCPRQTDRFESIVRLQDAYYGEEKL